VGKKQFKRAVDRNRIKRLTREAYRVQKTGLLQRCQEEDCNLRLMFVYIGKELPEYGAIQDKICQALQRLERLVHENATHHT
jgi:ribonuclease P protein component